MIVMKFGGSSVESSEAIGRVAAIVASSLTEAPVVVVSAIGKTTGQLIEMAELAAAGETAQVTGALARLRAVHLAAAPRLVHWKVKQHFVELAARLDEVAQAHALSPAAWDAIASFGERLSSVIVTAALVLKGISAVHLDARGVIVTDEIHTEAAPLLIETYAKVRRAVAQAGSSRVAVMGGFIASTEAGIPTTLGRGGSDYTAALVGAALSAREIQIWTDVDGMLACDPRILPGGRCLETISYEEAGLMAKFGAKVLHPATVLPAMRQRIPIVIRNSRNPAAPGTRVVDNPEGPSGMVRCIACSGTAVTLVGKDITVDGSLGARVVGTLRRSRIRLEMGESSRSVFSILVPDGCVRETVEILYRELGLDRADTRPQDAATLPLRKPSAKKTGVFAESLMPSARYSPRT